MDESAAKSWSQEWPWRNAFPPTSRPLIFPRLDFSSPHAFPLVSRSFCLYAPFSFLLHAFLGPSRVTRGQGSPLAPNASYRRKSPTPTRRRKSPASPANGLGPCGYPALSHNMNNADYYTSDPDSAASQNQPGLAGYDPVVSQSRPSSPFGFQTTSYADPSDNSDFLTPSYSSYSQSNFLQTVDSQEPVASWPQQVTASPPTTLPDSAAMVPSHLSFFTGDGDSVFPRYAPMDNDAIYTNRCVSPCAESCKSQCGEDGEADVCHDPNCEDVSDFCTDADCVDQVACSFNKCPVTGLSSGDEDAAATLASIQGSSSDPGASPGVDGELSTQTQSSLRIATSASPQSSLMASPPLSSQYTGTLPNCLPHQPMTMPFYPTIPGDFSMNLDLVDDLIMYHNPQQQSHPHSSPHFRPCPLDNAQLLTRRCMLPRSAYPEPDATSLGQMAGANNYDLLQDACGMYLSGPDEVLPHIANNHPRAFTTLQSYLQTSATAPGMSEASKAALLSAIGAVGPPKTPGSGSSTFDPYSTTPSSTPNDSATPLTQGSDATLDTVDSASQFVCKWQEDSGKACGKHFDDAESLHQHVVTHSRNLKKVGAGHRCRWAGCTRADGPKGCFPQRTKLERHLQTHTGCEFPASLLLSDD